MNVSKHLPLTETVFYILMALIEPAHGYLILQKIEALSKGEVRMAAGTLYGAIENLLKLEFIQPIPSTDARRKVYLITDLGREVLQQDIQRKEHMIKHAHKLLNETNN